jgi:hypothetical protein
MLAAVIATAGLAVGGCTSKFKNFDVFDKNPATQGPVSTLIRAETADNGGGSAAYPGGHSLTRVTIGGGYSRAPIGGTAGAHGIDAGVHGKPAVSH